MEDTLAGHCKYHHGNPHHAGHHQLHGSVMQKKVHNGVGSAVHLLFGFSSILCAIEII